MRETSCRRRHFAFVSFSALCRPRSALLAACLAATLSSQAAAQPVQHILAFKFKADAPPEAVREILVELDELPSKVPGIVGLQWGANNSPENMNQGLTHAFIMTFESVEARDAYLPHPEHVAFRDKFLPLVEDLFVFDFEIPEAPRPAEPGRVHHLVFFKFKEGVSAEDIAKVNAEFAALERKVSGLLRYQAGPENLQRGLEKGFTHGYVLTFIHDRARNDYIIHPAHREFGGLVGPKLAGALVVDFTVVPSSRGLFVLEGLEPYAVYQRDADGVADIRFSGVSRDPGAIEARLRKGRRTVPGYDWREVGRAEGGAFQAVFEDIPTGGEYTVEVRRRDALGNVGDHTEVANVLVGDIWILAGQSNMEGVGVLENVEEPSPSVHCYTMAHRWELAEEPLHWLIDSPDPVHSGPMLKDLDEEGRRERRARAREARRKGAGLGIPFAKEIVARTGVPIGLIAAAHGGTSMEQWDPAGRDLGGATLYGSLSKQVRNAGGKARGVLWYQGESDANAAQAPLYLDRMKKLVAAFRKDLGDPELPFYYVQIGRFVAEREAETWNRVQEIQRIAELEIPRTGVVAAVDLPLDDLIHVSTAGLKRLGRRLAKLALRDVYGHDYLQRGPRLESATLSEDGRSLRVKFSGVTGSLLPHDQVHGFSLRRKDGAETKLVYNARVDPESPDTVLLQLQAPPPEGAVLYYGAGLDPVANLVDEEDMAAPVMGPIELRRG